MTEAKPWVGDHVRDEVSGRLAILTDVRRGDYVLRPVQGPGEWIAEDPARLRFIAPATLPRRTREPGRSDSAAEMEALIDAGAFWRLAPEWVPRDGYAAPSPAVLRELEAGLKRLAQVSVAEVPAESLGLPNRPRRKNDADARTVGYAVNGAVRGDHRRSEVQGGD
ncbi:hypothetical protein [Streptomyces sp. 4R-3d]|uniref:hypothetical protein n=1 Tax=Streptomyces sp. 4R-3d TaxID=2559605 RepID=UPI001071A519|nr:hypothetical protein [Streptomyces sp. 4R-3d]TFI28684.1 hypothetical protein E4P36_10315 [Streptomyces sp. 4R-3d]